MFLALAIQVTNYIQSINKRVVAEMTWKSQEGAPIASLFSEANFLRSVGNDSFLKKVNDFFSGKGY
jgi:hypothetical protein